MKITNLAVNQSLEPLADILKLRMSFKYIPVLNELYNKLEKLNQLIIAQYKSLFEDLEANSLQEGDSEELKETKAERRQAISKQCQELLDYENDIPAPEFDLDEFLGDISKYPQNETADLPGDTFYRLSHIFTHRSPDEPELPA